jgi:hypothetical protein
MGYTTRAQWNAWAHANKDKVNRLRRETRDRRRKLVFEHYGNKCSCCGESNTRFLTIDHVNNDGAAQRKLIGRGTEKLWNWIVSNKFPDTVQLLCWNCNLGKHFNHGMCPHKEIECSN